jgi:ADP-ribosylglycohydrolase
MLTIALAESLIAKDGVDLDDIARKHIDAYLTGERGWGRATTAAIEKLIKGVPPTQSGEPSTGNGVAMKIAPVGLWYAIRCSVGDLDIAARAVGRITHDHPDAMDSGLLQARLVRMLARDTADVPRFLENATAVASEFDDDHRRSPLAENVYEAFRLANRNAPLDEALGTLGTSGNVIESLPAALYLFSKTPRDFEATVIESASAGHDTDTVAAMAGALSGALNGIQAIPERFLKDLENRQYLEELATRLYRTATRP